MAILTVQQLLVAARIITDATDVPAQTLAVANALYPGCVALINQYAPMVSDDVKNLALERLFSWMWESDVQSGDVSDPLQASGALSLLSLAGVVPALSTVASLPAITGFTVGDIINVGGELYELVANTDDANILRGTIFQRTGNYWGSAATGEVDFEFTGVSPYNIRLNIIKTDLPSPPHFLYIRITMSSGQTADVNMGRSSASDTTARYAYNKVEGQPGLDVPTAGETYSIEVFSDSGFSTAQSVHAAHRWEAHDRESPVSPVALVGNTDRWGKAKLPADVAYDADLAAAAATIQRVGTLVEDTTYPGFTLVTTSNSYQSAPSIFSPAVDLDDNPHGEFHVELDLTLVPVSDVNMSFVRGTSSATIEQRQVVQSSIVFASNLAEADVWANTNPEYLNGLQLFSVVLYSANTILGTYYMRLMRNSDNQVGVFYNYIGQAGGTGATLNAELRVTFTPSDASIANRNARGALLATTSAFPTTTIAARNTLIPVTWTFTTEGNKYFETTTTPGLIRTKSRNKPAGKGNVFGVWVVPSRHDGEVEEALFTWRRNGGWVYCDPNNANCRFNFSLTDNDRYTGMYTINDNIIYPPNIIVRIYEAVI